VVDVEGPNVGTRSLTVTTTVALELVDDLYPGRYVMRELTIADRDGGGVTPELIRSIKFGPLIMETTRDGLTPVRFEVDRIVDHHDPEHTLTADENLVSYWLAAKLCGIDTNGFVAAAFNITRAAAAQRIARLRREGMIPAAERQGARR
jgi:hypothetical protein